MIRPDGPIPVTVCIRIKAVDSLFLFLWPLGVWDWLGLLEVGHLKFHIPHSHEFFISYRAAPSLLVDRMIANIINISL